MFRLGTGIVLAVVLSTGVYTTYVMHTLQIEADQHLQERVDRQASVLSHALARPLFDINGAAVASVVDALGAVDDITKPVSPPILFARVATELTLAGARRQLQAHNENLEKLVQDRTAQLALMQEAIIMALGTLAETRDNTAVAKGDNHIRRTQHYVRALARHLQRHPRFAADLTDENIELLYRSVPLHDIGKVGIPDRILQKPGLLDREEFEVMKLHAVYGRDTIMLVEKHIGGTNGFLMFAREIAHSHQEKWDGSGYPDHLAGERIPLSARLMAVADVYDALISRRVYKPAFTHQQALDVMRKGRGTHFDPDVLDAFFEIEDRFAAIAEAYHDTAGDGAGA